MPDLLLELFSEEIPARMQGRAADDLKRLVTDALVERGFLYEGAVAFATPRRLALHVAGLPAAGKDAREEHKGPRVGAPEAALAGFLKKVGLASVDQLTVKSEGKKGDSYVAVVERPGRATVDVLAEILPGIVRTFPWPKSMRWGAASREPGSLRWVRPLQSILCTFGSDLETPEIVPFAVDGLASSDVTHGHRFMAPGPITVRRFEDYVASLDRAKVVLDPARRRDIVLHDARDLAFAQGLEVVEDPGLLDEVAGLVEWPVVLAGTFDESFLAIPPEAIRATIRANQKCFVLRRPDGSLANRFILTANIEASDGGAAIVAGNERVVRARLADARFFWESDLAALPDYAASGLKPLDQRAQKLVDLRIVFHERLGTQAERVDRIAALARELAPVVGADPALAERAARLCKADLVTEMVGEFPELQGLMGRYYAEAQGEDPAVAAAIEEHYRPLGPSDRVPTAPVSVAVALADKLDTLVGFWAIGETPTGSKDPYALRRAALGVIRLVLENGCRLRLSVSLSDAGASVADHIIDLDFNQAFEAAARVDNFKGGDSVVDNLIDADMARIDQTFARSDAVRQLCLDNLLSFFHDRLKVYLRERGARHDLIDAVLGATPSPAGGGSTAKPAGWGGAAAGGQGGTLSGSVAHPTPSSGLRPEADPPPPGEGKAPLTAPSQAGNDDLLAIVRRVEALGRLLATEDGRNLLAGTKRALNILRIEEKKDGRRFDASPDPALLVLPEERGLAEALAVASGQAAEFVAAGDDEGAMRALAGLRPAVDAFFDAVTVNDADPARRANRLNLLGRLRAATGAVADMSLVEG